MNILITTTAFTALFCGAAFAQSSDIAHEAHRFVNNASAVSHVNSSTHEKMLSGSDANSKTSSSSFNELNAGEKAALVHEQVNNAGAEAHQTQARKLRGLYSTR